MSAQDALNEFFDGVKADYGIGRDDLSKAFYAQRNAQELDDDAPRLVKMAAEHPLIFRTREMMGKANPVAMREREKMGMGLMPSTAGRAGQMVGTIGADLTQDISRNWWWLFNAAQATGNVINESALGLSNPDLFGATKTGVNYNDLEALESAGYATKDSNGTIRRNRDITSSDGIAKKRNYRSGYTAALAIPAGAAINNSLGLLTPGGGYEGYEAVFPSDEDPSKTSNMLQEVAAKYFLGRTGNLLPYDEFKKVRPDVSKGEYMKYKAFKFNKETDLNPFDDGQMTAPAAIAKYTNDGIHGPEVQFLGRSLPVATGLVPFASAVAGGALGVRKRKMFRDKMEVDPNAVTRGVLGGSAGAIGGTIVGNLLEGERRRRNQEENESYNQL